MTPFPIEPARADGPVRLVLSTFPDERSAVRFARAAVRRRLAACATLLPVRSIYRWNGRLVDDAERLVLFKTAPKRVGSLFAFLDERHPYTVPEVAEVDLPRVLSRYAAWVDTATRAGAEEGRVARLTSRPARRRGLGGPPPARTRARRRRRSR